MPMMKAGPGRALLGGGGNYGDLVLSTGPTALWMQNESSGLTAYCLTNPAMNGTYNGVTLANDNTGPFGTPAPWFDGATSFNNIYSAALAAAFSGLEGTAMIWGKVANVGVWTDTVLRSLLTLRVNVNNYVLIAKSNVNNTRDWYYRANAVSDLSTEAAVTSLDWACHFLTWSDSGDQALAYIDGAQNGVAMAPIETWAGALVNGRTNIGADNTVGPANVFHGWEGPCGIWTRVLPLAEIASLSLV